MQPPVTLQLYPTHSSYMASPSYHTTTTSTSNRSHMLSHSTEWQVNTHTRFQRLTIAITKPLRASLPLTSQARFRVRASRARQARSKALTASPGPIRFRFRSQVNKISRVSSTSGSNNNSSRVSSNNSQVWLAASS